MSKKLTPPQTEVLKALVRLGGEASPYELAYPRTPMLRRLRDAGLIALGPAPSYDEFNCDFTITDAGRAAINAAVGSS
jgi:hypothetical protein